MLLGSYLHSGILSSSFIGIFRASYLILATHNLNPVNQEEKTLHSWKGSIMLITCQVFLELLYVNSGIVTFDALKYWWLCKLISTVLTVFTILL
jgi:hypothetical protein